MSGKNADFNADKNAAQDKKTGRFLPGNPGYGLRIREAVEEADRQAAMSPEVATGTPRLLAAMIHVTSQKTDHTELQKECRLWLKENRSAFMSKMADLEKAFASKAPPEKMPFDPGEELILKMCQELLDEANGVIP
jgi:hypothetical protein